MKKNVKRWSILLKLLHWLMALLLGYMLVRGYFKWHKAIGLVLLALAVLRVFACMRVPSLGDDPEGWRRVAARMAHMLLYAFMLGIPVTGLLRSLYAGQSIGFYGLFKIASFVEKDAALSLDFSRMHFFLVNAIWPLLALHAAAALYHHVVLGDDVLRRMLFLPAGRDDRGKPGAGRHAS